MARTSYETRQNIRFSPDDWPQALKADLYLPQTDEPAPAVLVIHGGGWERRSRDDMTRLSRTLASRGFMVMNIDYRFAPEHRFPAQLQDAQLAMRWLHSHADDLGIDARYISAFGFSSGAHLVTMLAAASDPDHPHSEPLGGPITAPVAIVAGGLPADLRTFGSGKLLRQLLGGTREEYPQRYEAASPAAWIDQDWPPHFLFHGTWDQLVPIEQAKDFHHRLSDAGVHSELYRMRLRGHITSFLFSGAAVNQATVFLERHGAPERTTDTD